MAEGKGKIKGKIKKKLIISIVSPILIVLMLASSFFGIVDGMVEIIEGFLTKLSDVTSTFLEHPDTYVQKWIADLTQAIEKWWTLDANNEFNPKTLGVDALYKPSIVVSTKDFENIKNNIDLAQVNREEAGLEDYMLKIMLLSYYRSVYLKDYNIYMELTEEEAKEIEILNDEADIDKGKFPCPFEMIERKRCGRCRVNRGVVFKDNRDDSYRKNCGRRN